MRSGFISAWCFLDSITPPLYILLSLKGDSAVLELINYLLWRLELINDCLHIGSIASFSYFRWCYKIPLFSEKCLGFCGIKRTPWLGKILNKTEHNFCFTASLPAPFLAATTISFSHTHTHRVSFGTVGWTRCWLQASLVTTSLFISDMCNKTNLIIGMKWQRGTEGSVAPKKTTVRRSHKERHRAGQLMWKQNIKTNIFHHNHSVAGEGEKSQLFTLLRGAGIAPLLRRFAGSLCTFTISTVKKKGVGGNLPKILQSQHREHLFYSTDKFEKLTGLVWSATVWIRCGKIL